MKNAVIIWASLLFLSLALIGQSPQHVLRNPRSIALPGIHGGFDHLAFDQQQRRIYLAAEDNGSVEVMDIDKLIRVASLTGFQNPHSLLLLPRSGQMLVTDSGPKESALVDLREERTMRKLELALGANCLLFDRQRNRVYITAGGDRVGQTSSTLISVEPETGRVLKQVAINVLHLQPMALDPATNRLFVNFADKAEIGIFNRDTLQQMAVWKLPKGNRNSPIALDSAKHRLFVVCDDPGLLLVLNSDTGKLEQELTAPADADDVDFDPVHQRLFIPGDGELSVYDVSSQTRAKPIALVATPKGSRTGLFVAAESKYLLAVPQSGNGERAEVLVYDVQ